MEIKEKIKLLETLEEEIGTEYFELINIANLFGVMCKELDNPKVSEKVEEFIDFLKKEAKRCLERKEAYCNYCAKLYNIKDDSGFCSQKCHDNYYDNGEDYE